MRNTIGDFFNSLCFNFLSFFISMYVTFIIKKSMHSHISGLMIDVTLKVSLVRIRGHLLERTEVAGSSICLNEFCGGSQYRHF